MYINKSHIGSGSGSGNINDSDKLSTLYFSESFMLIIVIIAFLIISISIVYITYIECKDCINTKRNRQNLVTHEDIDKNKFIKTNTYNSLF